MKLSAYFVVFFMREYIENIILSLVAFIITWYLENTVIVFAEFTLLKNDSASERIIYTTD